MNHWMDWVVVEQWIGDNGEERFDLVCVVPSWWDADEFVRGSRRPGIIKIYRRDRFTYGSEIIDDGELSSS